MMSGKNNIPKPLAAFFAGLIIGLTAGLAKTPMASRAKVVTELTIARAKAPSAALIKPLVSRKPSTSLAVTPKMMMLRTQAIGARMIVAAKPRVSQPKRPLSRPKTKAETIAMSGYLFQLRSAVWKLLKDPGPRRVW